MPVLSPAIEVTLCLHRNHPIIAVRFDYDMALVHRFRQLSGARWSQTLKN